MNLNNIIYWIVRIIAALILMQTLFFKFSGSPESVFIFTTVGMEPWGRISVGVAELIASILLLLNRTAWIGAILALGLMTGAIGMHFTRLGIEVQDDGGQLFIYAIVVFLSSAFVFSNNWKTVKEIIGLKS